MNLKADSIARRRSGNLTQLYITTLQYLLINTLYVISSTAHFSWPNGHIPYLDDLALIVDPDQAVALNNARMDLQVRSCVRFYPRRLERDFVFFTDLGPQVECWNMFDHPKGKVEVNAGPSCLEPMRRPYRPHRVFSDCDIEYINHLYNCPRRRSVSPICPPGQNIMSRPQIMTLAATTEIHSIISPTTITTPVATAATETIRPSSTLLTTNQDIKNENNAIEATVATTLLNNEDETTQSAEYTDDTTDTMSFYTSTRYDSVRFNKIVEDRYGIGESGEETDDHQTIISNSNIDYDIRSKRIMTTEHPDWHKSQDVKTLEEEERETSHAFKTTTIEPEPEYTDSLTSETHPEDERFPTETDDEYSTVTITTISQPSFPTLVHTRSTDASFAPNSNFFPYTEGQMWQPRQPLPLPHTQLMMTLITTPSTTTTTFAPPPPDWVRSVEVSFESRQNGGKIEIDSMTAPVITVIEQPTAVQSRASEEIVENGFLEGSSHLAEKENYPSPLLPSAFIGGSRRANQFVLPIQSANLTTAGDRNVISTSASREMSNGEYSVSQTKVTTTIEKSKFIGPCGSACLYSGDLVKLYRSYNEKSEVTDHFYTTDRLEHYLMASQGYTVKPNVGYLGRNHVDPLCSCLKPLYRLYNDFMKDHLLTAAEHEKDMAERILGYKFERVLGFCTKEPGCGAYVPLYRFYNPISKDHLYTSDQQEMHYYKTHPEQAYGFENIECYIWQHNSSTKGCPALMLTPGSTRSSSKEFAQL